MTRLPISFDITNLARGYAEAQFAPADIVREVYARIRERADDAAWISLVREDDAQARAKAAPRGPLYGIPFAVKDNIDCAGLPTTCACPEFAYTPTRSARVVERLEAAGAIVIGKTNLDQFATGLNGTRSPYGTPRNPFNPAYIPGGSSSGSAVVVADGLVSFALGTDTAGSGRVPAAFNNIVGLKPTKGTLSARGLVPACRTLDTISIFALTVADALQAFQSAAAFDPEDGFSRAMPGAAPQLNMKSLRLGIPERAEFLGDAEAERAFAGAIARAQSLGCELVPIDYAPFAAAAKLLYQGPWVAERLAALKGFLATVPADAFDPTVHAIISGGANYSATDTFTAMYELAQLTATTRRAWDRMDVLMLPSAPTIYTVEQMRADPIRLNSNLGLYTNFVNLMDLSALAIPSGFRGDGLPCGVTLIGPEFADLALAGIGDALHRAWTGATLGARAHPLSATPTVTPAAAARPQTVDVAVVGAHLSGQPLNSQLTERGARLVRSARTAPGYSFYALTGTTPLKPGLIFDGQGAGRIEVEVWQMDASAFGSFVDLIPAPLGIGTVQLDDGSAVKGFLCEAHGLSQAQDITALGGWRAYLATLRAPRGA